jgi:hypothetical protein
LKYEKNLKKDPNGGKYKAKWEHGKMMSGDYYF